MPRRYLEKDILPHIGSKPVRDITAEDAQSVRGVGGLFPFWVGPLPLVRRSLAFYFAF